MAETKGRLGTLIEHLEGRFGNEVSELRLHLDGCPHACGQHWVGDLGFQGTTVRDAEGKRHQGYDILLRGALGPVAAIGRPVFRRVPTEELNETVESLIVAWLDARAPGESFRAYCDRTTDDELGVLIGREPAKIAPRSKGTRGGGSMSTHIDEQLDDWEAGELSVEFEGQEPWDLLEWAIDRFGGRLAISTAFQEGDVALIDMAYKIDPDVRVFSMDTGRLPQETFDLIEQLRDRYEGLRLELISPDAGQVQRLVDRHGPNLFFKSVENRLLCCNVRKVQPLTRALADLDAWVTGLRRDQWASRSDIRKVEIDHDHGAIVKLNPLAEWQEDEVWEYLRENEVPTHPLYEQGYTSIGCAPCTKPVAAGQPVRAGRWWWETDAPKECGMHCAIETGGFEHELHAILGEGSHA